MRKERNRFIAVCLIAVLIVALFPGCSAFKAKKRPNLTPFAEHIIAMSENIKYGLSDEPTIWLNKYAADPEIAPLIGEFRTSATTTRRILRAIVAYSIEVVTLAQSRATGSERADALADYVNSLMGPAFDVENIDLHITRADFDSIIVDMREQVNLYDGLNSAQPVADEIARIVGEHIAQTELLLFQLNEAISAAIEANYGPQLRFREVLQREQVITLRSIELLMAAVDGDETAMDELWESDPILLRNFSRGKELNSDDAQIIMENAMLRFSRIESVRKSVWAELEVYEIELLELHRLTMEAQSAVRRARATALAWAQAHRKLAAGIVDPAQIDMMGITQRVLGGVL
jgi:hypothetical protein